MPRKNVPGRFEIFNGLWARGSVDITPPDHFSDCRNNTFIDGVSPRDKMSQYINTTDVVRMRLYKPNPPDNPRIIYLNNAGVLYDENDTTTGLDGNVLWKDFSLVNFFGRAYITFSDGKVGVPGFYVAVYDGTGPTGFRTAGGSSPTNPIVAVADASGGVLDVGTYLIGYAFETASGFITRPSAFVAIDSFGSYQIDVTTLPTGPAGTAARWLIVSKAIPLREDLGVAFDVGKAQYYPLYFGARIGNNTDTTYLNYSFYDESLVDEANYLFTQLTQIPCGVGLLDYKGRLVSYGESADPSLIRISESGEPEAVSETSGFIITDPTDSTGVRSAIEFRDSLYYFKRSRGAVVQDNGLEPSTWIPTNFEKAIGAEQYGIADVLDAKGASSSGFLIASLDGLYYFNGVFSDPELSYKIRDLWLRINQSYFHRTQLALDPINKRIYFLVPLDNEIEPTHIIYGDYRNGMSPQGIKWSLWELNTAPNSIIIYTNFDTNDIPTLATRISNNDKILTLNIGEFGDEDLEAISSWFEMAPARFGDGISEFNALQSRVKGPCTLNVRLWGMDKTYLYDGADIVVASGGREYHTLLNLQSEHGVLRISHNTIGQSYTVVKLLLEGTEIWKERAG